MYCIIDDEVKHFKKQRTCNNLFLDSFVCLPEVGVFFLSFPCSFSQCFAFFLYFPIILQYVSTALLCSFILHMSPSLPPSSSKPNTLSHSPFKHSSHSSSSTPSS